MPQATDEQRKEWNGPDPDTATAFLTERGFVLNADWTWSAPGGREPTAKEWSAIEFMVDEWDYGGLKR